MGGGRWRGGGAQRPVLCVNEPKKTGACSAAKRSYFLALFWRIMAITVTYFLILLYRYIFTRKYLLLFLKNLHFCMSLHALISTWKIKKSVLMHNYFWIFLNSFKNFVNSNPLNNSGPGRRNVVTKAFSFIRWAVVLHSSPCTWLRSTSPWPAWPPLASATWLLRQTAKRYMSNMTIEELGEQCKVVFARLPLESVGK